jgi:hypothetical protein
MKQFHNLLNRFQLMRDLALGLAATVIACGFTAACHTSHPDDKQAVYNSLTSHGLPSVMVDQDRGKGVIKLTGVVGSAESKDSAQQLAQEAAPGYTVDNQIRVDETGIMSMAKPTNGDQATTGKGNDTGVPDGAEKTKPHKKHRQ